MFHIFDNILLAPDFYIAGGIKNNIIALTKFDDYDFSELSDVIQLFTSDGYFEIYSSSYDSIVGDGKRFSDDQHFFEYILKNRTKKYGIFADKNTYSILVAKTLKLIFPKITSQHAWMIYKLSLDYFYIFFHYLRYQTESVKLIDNSISYSDVAKLSKDQFIALFEKTTFTGDRTWLVENFQPYISTEYKLANFLIGHSVDEDGLKKTLREFLSSLFYVVYREIQQEYVLNAFALVDNDFDQNLETILNKQEFLFKPQATDHKKTITKPIKDVIQNNILDEQNLVDILYKNVFFMSAYASGKQCLDHLQKMYNILQRDDIHEYIQCINDFVQQNKMLPHLDMSPDRINPFLMTYILTNATHIQDMFIQEV